LGTGATSASVRSSLDGFASDISMIAVNAGGYQELTFDLSTMPFVSGNITFRIYFWGASAGLTDWDDLVSSAFGGSGLSLYSYSLATASDNCGIASVNYTNYSSNYQYPVGTTTVTATATDLSGNASSCSFSVIVTDNEAPVISCAPGVTINTDPDQCYGTTTLTAPTVSDNCSVFSKGSELVTNGDFSAGSTGWGDCGNLVEAYCTELCYGGSNGSNEVAEIDHEPVTLCQNISGFIVGRTYTLSFLASRRDVAPATVGAIVTIDGGALNVTVNRSNPTFSLTPENFTFVATQATHQLAFVPTSGWGGTLGFIVDDISITQSPGTITNNAPTTYPVGNTTVTWTATDYAGNTSTCTQVVSVNAPAISCTAGSPIVGNCSTNILCNGGTGSAYVNVTGSCSPFTYLWSNGATTNPVSGLAAGNYNVTVTDANGITTTCAVTLSQPAPLTATATTSNPLIFYGYTADNTAPISGTSGGGCGTRTNSWLMSRGLLCNVVNGSGDESLTLGWNVACACTTANCSTPAGTYSGNSFSATLTADANFTLVVTDGNGCTATSTVHIDAIDARCFAGNSGNQKVQICHHTGSQTNPYVTLCVDQNAVAELISHGDCIGSCSSYSDPMHCTGYRKEATEENALSAEAFNVYPNPFNNKATVAFSVPADGNAVVKVFDALGKQVAVLFDGIAKSGTEYKVEFNGSDYSPGMYFYSIISNEMNLTKRMQLIK
jgi:hypothetical protein